MTDAYIGLASLAITAFSIRLWFRAAMRVEIPRNRGGFVAAWAGAATLALVSLLGEPGWFAGIAAGLSLIAAGFCLFSVAIGGQKLATDAIRVGANLPEFAAADEHGKTFESQSLAGHPVLIKFFRGHW